MAEDRISITPHLLDSVRDGSDRLALLATGLSDSIGRLQNWLRQLSGKVEAQAYETQAEVDEDLVVLAFRRLGGDWYLACRSAVADGEGGYKDPGEWVVLGAADVDRKIRSVALFPLLVHIINRRLTSRCRELEGATADVDKLLEATSKKGGE